MGQEKTTVDISARIDEGHYRLLVESVVDYAITMLSTEGIVTSWNAGARRFMGYEPFEIIGEHFSKFYTPEDKASSLPEQALKTAIKKGKFEDEGWRVRKDGTHFWAHVVIDPIFSPPGELVGFAKITRDLTERRKAEEELRKSQEQFKILIQGVTDYAIFLLDKKGCVSSWNMGAQRIKGYLPEEIIGSHFSKFYTQEDLDNDLPQFALDTAIKEGKYEKEGWRVRKDGTRFWASVIIDPIFEDDGRLVGFAKITRDITERKNAQIALEKTREALFQSQKMEAIGQLTGGIAHDFNNLLMIVLGSLDLLRRRLPNDQKYRVLIDNASQGAQRGVSLTQRMLAFARRQELSLVALDISKLVEGMSELLQRVLGASVIVRTEFERGRQMVKADVNQLELAIMNLAMNARDAMPNGGTIKISTAEKSSLDLYGYTSSSMDSFIVLSVTDNGEGMDEQTLKKAAEPFFTTKGVGKGTGLGLSMVHGVAEQSGGRLLLHSKKGEGTVAELWLPAAIGDVAGVPDSKPREELAKMSPLNILVVEDDPLVLLNTVEMLEELDHKIIQTNSGKLALEIFQHNERIDLVITDQLMPDMTGTQLIDILKTIKPDLPVILATGYAELPPGAATDLLSLRKPYDQNDLARVIESAMRERQRGS